MRRRLVVAVALALAGAAASAQQVQVPFAETVVAVTINGEQLPDALVVRRDADGTLLVRAADLKTLRLKTPTTGAMLINGQRYYRIGKDLGAQVVFDDASQSVDLTLPPQALAPTTTQYASAADRPPPQAQASLGGFLNYDVSAQRAGSVTSVGGFVEAGVFGAQGVLTTTALASTGTETNKGVRLDTAWTRDFPERLTTLRVGDSISTAGAWGRSVRFGGIQYGTNFNTQPTLVTTPLLSATGDAIVPSTVDVFVNGQPVASEQVRPGPFEIQGVPAVNGSGQMQVVVTDALGRQQVITQPYYAGTALLRPGLTEYSVEAGAIRRDYTSRSNSYGDFVGAATVTRGLTDRVTAGVHVEGQSDGAAAAGVDGAVQVGTLGIVTASAAAGSDGDGSGWLGGLGLEHNGAHFSFYARGAYATEGFAQLADGALEYRPKLRAFSGLGFGLSQYGSLQFAYGVQTNWFGPSLETMGFGYSLTLGRIGFLNLFASHTSSDDAEDGPSNDVFLTWTMPLGDRRMASATLRNAADSKGKEHIEATATVQQSLPVGPGSGYVASITSGSQANLGYSYQGTAGTVGAEYAHGNGQDGVRVGATGGLAITGAGVMPTRRIDQSFAVVQLADYPNVEVFVENQPVGRTDSKGRILLDNLLPYQANEVSVDPNKLPQDAALASRSVSITPAYRSGVVVKFPISHAMAVTLRLVQADGKPVPPGAQVQAGDGSFPVGMGGSVYLTGIDGRESAVARWRGGECAFVVERPAGNDPYPDLGKVSCVASTAGSGAR